MAILEITSSPPEFDDTFQGALCDLFAWRRDVRRFRGIAGLSRDPVDPVESYERLDFVLRHRR